jgi:CheY-like chemotaxis protein
LEWRVEFELQSSESEIQRLAAGAFELSNQTPLNSIPVRGDEGKLRQVLINLLGNAVKFTDAGRVTLRVASTCSTASLESASETDSRSSTFLFEVHDTGPGIPAHVRTKIFEPFTQDAEGKLKGGTGLGLSIAQRQVELLGGRLELESEPGNGSRFYFSSTFRPAETRVPAKLGSNGRKPKRLQAETKVRALVADDVPENQDILSWFLEDLGVKVTVVENGEQALDKLRSQQFDIAFLDIRMPKMTGLEVTQAVLRDYPDAKVKFVAISASVLMHEQGEYKAAGFHAFIPKPYRFAEVVECMETQLGVRFEYETDGASFATVENLGEAIVVDPQRFRELFSGDQKRLRKHLASYLKHTSAQLGQLRALVNSGNAAEIELIAHRCLGASSNLGIRAMARVMQRLEAMALSKDLSNSAGLLAEAEEAFMQVQKILQNWL